MLSTGVYHNDEYLIALLSCGGMRSAMMPTRAVLKVLNEQSVKVQCSLLEFFDQDGEKIAEQQSAFELEPGARLNAPLCLGLSSRAARLVNAISQKWTINDWSVSSLVKFDELDPVELRATYLPLLVPVDNDQQIVLDIVNRSTEAMNIMHGVRSAVLVVDGASYPSNAGGNWNGRYELPPGMLTTRRFQLTDFPGTPSQGQHEVSMNFLGMNTPSVKVDWIGESPIQQEQP